MQLVDNIVKENCTRTLLMRENCYHPSCVKVINQVIKWRTMKTMVLLLKNFGRQSTPSRIGVLFPIEGKYSCKAQRL